MKKSIIGAVFALTIALTGCAAGGNQETGTSEAPASSQAEETTKPITIQHSRGELTLQSPAKRVVVLEWSLTEDLVALGVQPVGSADNKGYATYITSEAALDDSVTDVGQRDEPNLETIMSLKPDLIISNAGSNRAIYEQLNGIAPTIEFDTSTGEGYSYDRMVEIFKTIGTAVGKEDKAEEVLADLDKHYAEAKETLAAAGKSDFHYVLTQAFTWQNAVNLRMFKDNSLVVGTLDNIGLVNDWKPANDTVDSSGITTIGIEGLSDVQDSNFIYIVQPDDDVFGEPMKDNTVWNGLNFVKEKRTYALDSKTWTFGGPISSKILVDGVVEVITK